MKWWAFWLQLHGYDYSQAKPIHGCHDSVPDERLIWPCKYFPYIHDEFKHRIQLFDVETINECQMLESPTMLKKLTSIKMNEDETMLMCKDEEDICRVIHIIR